MGSESALALMPLQVYGWSKYILEAYNDMLRMELALLGMHVALIRPGAHQTPTPGSER